MSFTYNFTTNPAVAQVRLLLADTVQFAPDGVTSIAVFQDEEINGAFALQASLCSFHVIGGGVGNGAATFPQAYPPLPVSPLRVAALLLNALASNQGRLQSITKLLDVSLSPLTAKDMRDQAQAYLKQDDESGNVMLIEQVTTSFAFKQRWFSQWQRDGQGVVVGGA